ncbi:hypothetical protein E4T39_04438 [Aureobasidium subglaciale]|nr:hypothetical protein E4T39_04438 [Aureobasidium subglaciale]
MEVPEWKVRALATGRTYVEALKAVVESYESQIEQSGVKKPLTPEATKDRLGNLAYASSHATLNFLVKKLQLRSFEKTTSKLDLLGGLFVCKIWAKGELISADIPMMRKGDAYTLAELTGSVRLLQRFGFDAIEGFEEVREARKAGRISPEGSDPAKQDAFATDEQVMADLFDSFDSLLEDTVVKEADNSMDEEAK